MINFFIIYLVLTIIPMFKISIECVDKDLYNTENIYNNFQDAFCFIFSPQAYIYNVCKEKNINELGCRIPVILFTIIFLPYGLIYFLFWILLSMFKQIVEWYVEIFKED